MVWVTTLVGDSMGITVGMIYHHSAIHPHIRNFHTGAACVRCRQLIGCIVGEQMCSSLEEECPLLGWWAFMHWRTCVSTPLLTALGIIKAPVTSTTSFMAPNARTYLHLKWEFWKSFGAGSNILRRTFDSSSTTCVFLYRSDTCFGVTLSI